MYGAEPTRVLTTIPKVIRDFTWQIPDNGLVKREVLLDTPRLLASQTRDISTHSLYHMISYLVEGMCTVQ